jgi:hypothetical protein
VKAVEVDSAAEVAPSGQEQIPAAEAEPAAEPRAAEEVATPPAPEEPEAPAVDIAPVENCEYWAQAGNCATNVPFMWSNCAYTCERMNPELKPGRAEEAKPAMEVATEAAAGAADADSNNSTLVVDTGSSGGTVLQPAWNYQNETAYSAEEFERDMESFKSEYEEVLSCLSKVGGSGVPVMGSSTSDSAAAAVPAVADEASKKEQNKQSASEMLEKLSTMPTVNQMRVAFANINARAANFRDDDPDSPFGGDFDEMIAYQFVGLDTKLFGANGNPAPAQVVQQEVPAGETGAVAPTTTRDMHTANLLCYSRGLAGEGVCRLIKTTKTHEMLRGPPFRIGVKGVQQVLLKEISSDMFAFCYDGETEAEVQVMPEGVPIVAGGGTVGSAGVSQKTGECLIVKVDVEGSNVKEWPELKFSEKRLKFGAAAASEADDMFQKMLSLTLLKPAINRAEHDGIPAVHRPAELAVCYFTNAYVKQSDILNKKATSLYNCANANFDVREFESLTLA